MTEKNQTKGSIDVTYADGSTHTFTSIATSVVPDNIITTDDVDSSLSTTSTNPVQNKTIAETVDNKADLVNGIVPSSQLPSYVDDVVEYSSLSEFPQQGEDGKIYLAIDTGFIYRWSGSQYVQIGAQDLSNYYTKTQTDTKLAEKADVGSSYTKSEENTLLNAKQNSLTAAQLENIDAVPEKQDAMQSLTDEEIEEVWNNFVDPVLDNNSWEDLKAFSLSVKNKSEIPSTWLGQTKDFTYLNRTYKARLVDTTGKHTRVSDGSKAWLLFEVTELNPSGYAFNSAQSNVIADSPLLKSLNNTDGTGARWLELPSDLRAILEDVNVFVAQSGYGTTTPINLPFKVFFGREHDLFSSRSYSIVEEFNAITQDEYYQSNNTNTMRIKYDGGTTTAREYWLMSPTSYSDSVYSGTGTKVCVILTTGGAYYGGTDGYSCRMALRFAI